MSLWRKRNVQHNEHNEQKHDNLSNPLDLLHDLSIKSEDLSIKSNKIWVDPPEGWKYGFPAIYDPDTDGQMSDWIISKGYPIQIIKEYGEQWMVRCWPADEPH
jgi:hypothetical protein